MYFDVHLRRCGMPYKPLYTIAEVAWMLNRSTQTVRNYLSDETLKGLRVGHRWAGVFVDSLERLIEKGVH